MSSKSRRFIIAATISILCVFQLAGFAQHRNGVKGPVEFSLKSIDGPAVTSESLRGEVVVLAFGASWLPLSRQQLEGVKKFADDYSGRGVAVYWVSTDSESSGSRNYASDDQLRALATKYKVTILRDPDGALSKRFGVDQLPAFVILDKRGNLYANIGGFDPNANLTDQLETRLKPIL
jgi:alkyl hydroperoxide reductase subunit AhpC